MQLVRRVDTYFAQLAQRLSSDEFIQFDRYAMWFYAACITLFLVAIVACLNGSSMAIYNSNYHRGAPQKTWLGKPRQARSDEWAYVTPDILNQTLRSDRFQVKDSALGSHSVALTGNIPVRHFTTFFRPQFWAFFVLPVNYAFAAYWQSKALLLVTGIFTWLLLITRSTLWAAAGSLWYFFSPFTQWSYSWPSALPEMIGSLSFAMVFGCYLTIGRHTLALFFAAIGAALSIINFALCAYPPHLIPLFWLAVFFCAAWCLANRGLILTRNNLAARGLALALAASIVAIVAVLVFIELRTVLIAIANTTYPGRRIFAPGRTHIYKFAADFMQWTEKEGHFPQQLGNICEGSGFLWLVPATLFCFRRMNLSALQKCALLALWAIFCLLFSWLVLPVPDAISKVFFLGRTAGARVAPALGLANISIVAISIASLRKIQFRTPANARVYYVSIMIALSAMAFFTFWLTNQQLASFFRTRHILFAAIFTGALITLLVTGRNVALAVALVIPLALVFGSVNPLERGTTVFTSSDLYKFVHQNPQLLNGKWIVFSDSVVNSGFVAATGCDVYTGMHYLPDLDHFPLFAEKGLDLRVLNRLGYLNTRPIHPADKSNVIFARDIVRWSVTPNDPILRQIGIKYLAFAERPSHDLVSSLVPVSARPLDGFWLYRLP